VKNVLVYLTGVVNPELLVEEGVFPINLGMLVAELDFSFCDGVM